MKQSERIEALEARISQLEAQLNPPPQPKPEPFRYFDGLERDGQGNVIPNPNLPSYEERMAQRRASEEANEKALWAQRTAGLPAGHWRDNSGLIRDAEGALVTLSSEARAFRSRIEAQLAAEDLARLERDNISTYQGEKEDEE